MTTRVGNYEILAELGRGGMGGQADGKEPTDPLAQADLIRAQAAAGDTVAALELAGRVERLPGLDNELRVALAKGLAKAATRQRGAGRERTNERAAALLNAAVENGYRDHFVLTHEPDFADLGSQARFTALLSRIKN